MTERSTHTTTNYYIVVGLARHALNARDHFQSVRERGVGLFPEPMAMMLPSICTNVLIPIALGLSYAKTSTSLRMTRGACILRDGSWSLYSQRIREVTVGNETLTRTLSVADVKFRNWR